jgi:hypothetical protein
MRYDEVQPPAHLIVYQTVTFVTDDAEHCCYGWRLVEDGACQVHEPLWLHPFLVEAGFQKLIVCD